MVDVSGGAQTGRAEKLKLNKYFPSIRNFTTDLKEKH